MNQIRVAKKSLTCAAICASLLGLASCSEKKFPFTENPNSFLEWLQNKEEFKKGQVRYEFDEVDFDRGNGCHAFKKDDHDYYQCYISLTEYNYHRLGVRRCRYAKVVYNRWNLGQTILTTDEKTCTHFERISPLESENDDASSDSSQQTRENVNQGARNVNERNVHSCEAFARMSGSTLSHAIPCEDQYAHGGKKIYSSFYAYCAANIKTKDPRRLSGCHR